MSLITILLSGLASLSLGYFTIIYYIMKQDTPWHIKLIFRDIAIYVYAGVVGQFFIPLFYNNPNPFTSSSLVYYSVIFHHFAMLMMYCGIMHTLGRAMNFKHTDLLVIGIFVISFVFEFILFVIGKQYTVLNILVLLVISSTLIFSIVMIRLKPRFWKMFLISGIISLFTEVLIFINVHTSNVLILHQIPLIIHIITMMFTIIMMRKYYLEVLINKKPALLLYTETFDFTLRESVYNNLNQYLQEENITQEEFLKKMISKENILWD